MKNTKTLWHAIFIAAAAIFTAAVVLLVYILCNSYFSKKPDYTVYTSSQAPVSSEPELPENPINFAELNQTNTDIYAWIRIENTVIDYPVLQSSDLDDDFYLNHDIDRSYKFAGSIFSEKMNSKDFSDPVTVLYGHNMLNGSMFQNLHKFRDKAFFEANKTITIYTPGHILTYEIFAAYKYDNRHIMNSFDFSDLTVRQEYFDYIQAPKSMLVNTRPVTLTTESKILTLSTCIGNEDNYRYLVQGVLTNDQPTK